MTRQHLASGGAFALSALALTACGASPGVDKGGFTAAQRRSAQSALDLLRHTGIPERVVAISYQAGQAPSMCSVVPGGGIGDVFRLVVEWSPTNPAYATQPKSVLQATIGSRSARHDHFQVTSFGGQGGRPEPVALAATVERTALARPAEQCQALENGDLELVPD